MPQKSDGQRLLAMINQLRSERDTLTARLQEINRVFSEIGLQPTEVHRIKTRRTRARQSGGSEVLMNFIREAGAAGRTRREISQKWKQSGFSGTPDVRLGQLVKRGDLKRNKAEGIRGSIYLAV